MKPEFFINKLKKHGINFFAGVPDSLLKSVCAYISDNFDNKHNIITANEGGAIGLATGYHLATGNIGCVYMQNSGLGNIVNPLTSLTDPEVYHIPMLLIIGWRGRPGVHDEPQHVKQGKVTTGLLNILGINYDILHLDEEIATHQIDKAVNEIRNSGNVYALIIEKGTFEPYTLQKQNNNHSLLSREESIQEVASRIEPNAVIVSTTGMISRELFEHRAFSNQGHYQDFLTVGSMGHASQIALGIAMQQPYRRVYCFDGDGAAIMHLGGLAIIGSSAQTNFVHIVFNNGAHDSVGGQPTVGFDIDMLKIATACGYSMALRIDDRTTLEKLPQIIANEAGPIFVEIRVKCGNRKDLGRPTTTPIENKEALMSFLKK